MEDKFIELKVVVTRLQDAINSFAKSMEEITDLIASFQDSYEFFELRQDLSRFYSLRAEILKEICSEGLQDGLLPDIVSSWKEAPEA